LGGKGRGTAEIPQGYPWQSLRHRPSGCGQNRSSVPGHTACGRTKKQNFSTSPKHCFFELWNILTILEYREIIVQAILAKKKSVLPKIRYY